MEPKVIFEKVRGEAPSGSLRRIEVYEDHKTGFRWDGKPYPDLLRSSVPYLTDEEWFSLPTTDWEMR
jgi:hypothetical protein